MRWVSFGAGWGIFRKQRFKKMCIDPATADIAIADASGETDDAKSAQGAAPVYDMLENGARGAEVHALQKCLHEPGYDPATADGIFDSKTANAIDLLQAQNALPVTGL